MKKAGILLVLLMTVPLVYATVSFDSFSSFKFNLGESIQLSGTSTDFGILSLELICGESAVGLGTISVIKGDFSRLIPLTGLTGDCVIKSKLTDISNNIIQEISSDRFKVSDELFGSFHTGFNNLQLGDTLKINGDVKNLNNQPIDGVAVFYLKKEGVIYLVDNTEVRRGEVSYSRGLELMPAGDYIIDVDVSDNFGNKLSAKETLKFKIYSKLSIIADLDKGVYLPGDELNLDVDIIKGVGGNTTQLFTSVDIDGNIYQDTDSSFSLVYKIPDDVKSYNHSIFIKSKDNHGNVGEAALTYLVDPIATSIDINLSKENFNPGDEMNLVVDVLDQAGDLMNADVNLEFLEGRKLVDSKGVKANENVKMAIGDYAEPGERVIRAESLGLKTKKLFVVNEVKALESNIKGQGLVLHNKGNVIYGDDLVINFDDGEIRRSLYLDVNKTIIINLANYLDDGIYKLSVENTGAVYENVEIKDERSFGEKFESGLTAITGDAVFGFSAMSPFKSGLFILILLVILISGIFVVKYNFKVSRLRRVKDFRGGKRRIEELKKEGRKYHLDFGNHSKEDIEDWKQNVLKGYEETRTKIDREKYSPNKRVYESDNDKQKDNGGNIFGNMFG